VLQDALSSAIFRWHSASVNRVLLGLGRPARDAVEVGHPDPLEPLDHLELARGRELGAEAGQLGDLSVPGSIRGEYRKHVRIDPGAPVPSRPVEGAGHHPLLLTLFKNHANRIGHSVSASGFGAA
jgi:hypothetical protein